MGSCVFQQPLSIKNLYFTPNFHGKYENIAGLDLKPIQLDYLTMKNISIYNNFVMEAQNTEGSSKYGILRFFDSYIL